LDEEEKGKEEEVFAIESSMKRDLMHYLMMSSRELLELRRLG
jgi:hypothetical protein